MSLPNPGIYLIVEFEWPDEFSRETAGLARQLHDELQEKDWIGETVAASGGIGGGPGSLWIFWLENYAALDRLLRDAEDEVGKLYQSFFSQMPVVNEKIREKVLFM